ncbi:hypothetical protein AVEN_92994-1, partial [Araneus ventricosus]
ASYLFNGDDHGGDDDDDHGDDGGHGADGDRDDGDDDVRDDDDDDVRDDDDDDARDGDDDEVLFQVQDWQWHSSATACFLRTACYLIHNEGGGDSEVFHVGSGHHGHDEVGSGHHGEVCGDDIHRVFLAREQHLYQSEVAWHREQLG